MDHRETSQSIDQQAAEWAAREDQGQLSEADARELEAWLAGDPRRPGALLRARAVFLRSEAARALGPGFDPDAFASTRRAKPRAENPSRRRFLLLTGAAAACAVLSGTLGAGLIAPEAHATELGEVRLVPLRDGSSVMLNTQTRVNVRYKSDQRVIQLVGGEADFRVVTDADREFVVLAGDAQLSTRGASFRVRHIPGAPLDILVYHGQVDVAEADAAGAQSLLVGPNSRLTMEKPRAEAGQAKKAAERVSPDIVSRELAWREGKLAFEGETLAAAAASFSRYSSTRIVINDPSLAGETIAGLFAANDPAGFSRSVAQIFDAELTVQSGSIILTRNHHSD